MNLSRETVLVTGASSGIGAAMARAALTRGARVVAHYHTNRSGAEAAIASAPERAHLVDADLADKHAVDAMFLTLREANFLPSVLVSNAAEAAGGDVLDTAAWEHQYHNVFLAALHPAQAFLAQEDQHERFRKLLFTSSIYGSLEHAYAPMPQYSVMKAAVSQLTRVLAREYAPNVLVNAIAPGWTETPAWDDAGDAERQYYRKQTLIERFVAPDDVAHLALATLENDALTGQIITIDGGVRATA